MCTHSIFRAAIPAFLKGSAALGGAFACVNSIHCIIKRKDPINLCEACILYS